MFPFFIIVFIRNTSRSTSRLPPENQKHLGPWTLSPDCLHGVPLPHGPPPELGAPDVWMKWRGEARREAVLHLRRCDVGEEKEDDSSESRVCFGERELLVALRRDGRKLKTKDNWQRLIFLFVSVCSDFSEGWIQNRTACVQMVNGFRFLPLTADEEVKPRTTKTK